MGEIIKAKRKPRVGKARGGRPTVTEEQKLHMENLYVHQLLNVNQVAAKVGCARETVRKLRIERDWLAKREEAKDIDLSVALVKYHRAICLLADKIIQALERDDIDELTRLALIAKNLTSVTRDLVDQTTTLGGLQLIEAIPTLIERIQAKAFSEDQKALLISTLTEEYELEYLRFRKTTKQEGLIA